MILTRSSSQLILNLPYHSVLELELDHEMARPAESPINISSASPTPTRPTLSLPRRSSSRSRISDLGPHNHVPEAFMNRNRAVPTHVNSNMDMPPSRRHQQPYVLMPSSSTSTSRARPTGLALPGPSRAIVARRDERVIDLTEDDEDEVEITGQYIAPVPAPGPARQMRDFPRDTPFPGDMDRKLDALTILGIQLIYKDSTES